MCLRCSRHLVTTYGGRAQAYGAAQHGQSSRATSTAIWFRATRAASVGSFARARPCPMRRAPRTTASKRLSAAWRPSAYLKKNGERVGSRLLLFHQQVLYN